MKVYLFDQIVIVQQLVSIITDRHALSVTKVGRVKMNLHISMCNKTPYWSTFVLWTI